HPRPPAPKELSPEEAREWREIVDALPADFFRREFQPLMECFVRAICAARDIARRLKAPGLDLRTLNLLSAMQARETSAIVSLARSMRFTPRARYEKDKRLPRHAPRPWE